MKKYLLHTGKQKEILAAAERHSNCLSYDSETWHANLKQAKTDSTGHTINVTYYAHNEM